MNTRLPVVSFDEDIIIYVERLSEQYKYAEGMRLVGMALAELQTQGWVSYGLRQRLIRIRHTLEERTHHEK